MRTAPTFEDIASKQVMNKVTAPSMPFQWSINPYRGCTHGCSFCYARSTHSFLGLATDDSFRNHIFVKETAGSVLASQLAAMRKRYGGNADALAAHVGLVAIGTATDPYQPIEARRQLTRQCLEVLAEYGILTSITTRSPLILRDLDLLQHMKIHSINISVNTLDTAVWRGLEPATPAPLKRLEAVRILSKAGLPAGVFLAPIVPFLTDSDASLDQVIAAASAHQAHYVMPSVMRLTPDVKAWFMQVISQEDVTFTLQRRLERLYRGTYPPKAYVDPLMERVRGMMARYGVASYSAFDRGQVDRLRTIQGNPLRTAGGGQVIQGNESRTAGGEQVIQGNESRTAGGGQAKEVQMVLPI